MKYLRFDLSTNEIEDDMMEELILIAKEIAAQNEHFEFVVLGTAISFEENEVLQKKYVGKIDKLDLKLNTVKKAKNDQDIPEWLKEDNEAETER